MTAAKHTCKNCKAPTTDYYRLRKHVLCKQCWEQKVRTETRRAVHDDTLMFDDVPGGRRKRKHQSQYHNGNGDHRVF